MKYFCHVLAGAPCYYLEIIDNLHKQICRTVVPSLAASIKPLAHCWNIASLSPFNKYCLSRCPSELAQLAPPLYSWRRCIYFDRLHDFSVTIPRCYKDVYVNSFFPGTTRLWIFRRKVMFHSQHIQVFIFLTIPWFTKPVTSWWVLVHETGCIF